MSENGIPETDCLQIANSMITKKYRRNLTEFPDLLNYLFEMEMLANVEGGVIRSRQVIALAIETWIRMNNVDMNEL